MDFPLPEPPTTAIRWPGVASNETPRRIGRSGSYANRTLSNRTSPRRRGAGTASGESLMSGWCRKTSRTRSPAATALASRPVYLAKSRTGLRAFFW